MGEKTWTYRGDMIEDDDEMVIKALAEKDRVAARIFITGEVSEDFIGENAAAALLSINDVYHMEGETAESTAPFMEPLFERTLRGTVRMTRFDAGSVWRWFHPDILKTCMEAEIRRLGLSIDPFDLERMDFYESVILDMYRTKGESAVPVIEEPRAIEDCYRAAYLACLLLFGKTGYMGVPVSEYFAVPDTAQFIKNVKFFELDGLKRRERDRLREKYSGVRRLTNDEMGFVVSLYKRHGAG